jgi:hypothetical protein
MTVEGAAALDEKRREHDGEEGTTMARPEVSKGL